ncbi:MAG: antitoxin [Cellulomonas sp.]|jgi:hypothetical protein|nr:antitoxin [Cellulomonas sp.]
MKLSISLDEVDLDRLDQILRHDRLASRSATIQRAIRTQWELLLGDSYEAAWAEWAADDAQAWETTTGDGLDDDETW